jgi:ABC-type multidrug transport system ATPase subunit
MFGIEPFYTQHDAAGWWRILMKTLSFPNGLVLGRSLKKALVEIPSDTHLSPGLHAILAPNGVGKSTLLQTLAQKIPPLRGHAEWDRSQLLENQVQYVSEYLTFPKFIYPEEWVAFVAKCSPNQSPERWKEVVELLRMDHLKRQFLGRMSQGERRKVTWAAVHLSEEPIVLLDEPLDGLDLFALEGVRHLIQDWKRRGRVMIFVAHQVTEVLDLVDGLWIMRPGDELTSTPARFESWIPSEWHPGKLIASQSLKRELLEVYKSLQTR